MAKQPVQRGGTTKVRFLMLEAEGAESDLTQIYSAIQSAVKPSTTVIQQRLVSGKVGQPLLVDPSNSTDKLSMSLRRRRLLLRPLLSPRNPKPLVSLLRRKCWTLTLIPTYL